MDAFNKWWASAVVTHEDGLISLPSHKAAFLDGKAEGIKEGMRRAAEIAGAEEDQFIALAGEAADNTMRKHYSALASGAGTAAAAILKEAGE